MRWIYGVWALLAVGGLTCSAAGFDPGCGAGLPCGGAGYTAYGASACASPFYGTVPGCCRNQPSPSDNAWDGFCEEQARWHGRWYRLGTGQLGGEQRYSAVCSPTRATCAGTVELSAPGDPLPGENSAEPVETFAPAASPVVEPVPDATTWRNRTWVW